MSFPSWRIIPFVIITDYLGLLFLRNVLFLPLSIINVSRIHCSFPRFRLLHCRIFLHTLSETHFGVFTVSLPDSLTTESLNFLTFSSFSEYTVISSPTLKQDCNSNCDLSTKSMMSSRSTSRTEWSCNWRESGEYHQKQIFKLVHHYYLLRVFQAYGCSASIIARADEAASCCLPWWPPISGRRASEYLWMKRVHDRECNASPNSRSSFLAMGTTGTRRSSNEGDAKSTIIRTGAFINATPSLTSALSLSLRSQPMRSVAGSLSSSSGPRTPCGTGCFSIN